MSSLDGRLRAVVAYKSLGHIGPTFCLISIRWLQRLSPCYKCLIHMKIKVNFKEKCCSSHWEISASCTIQNAITLQHLNLIFHIPLCCLLSVRSREVKNKRQFQTLSSESGHVSFQEVPNTTRLRELVATGGSSVQKILKLKAGILLL